MDPGDAGGQAAGRRGRWRPRRALGIVLAAAALAGVWAVWPRGSTLLRLAVPVPCPFGQQHHWLSDHELLVFQPEPSKPGRAAGRVEVIDARTGARRVAARYAMPGDAWLNIDTGAVSPDGRWTVWMGSWTAAGSGKYNQYAAAISLSGGAPRTYPPTVAGRHRACWSPDSCGLLLATWTPNVANLLRWAPLAGPARPGRRLHDPTGADASFFALLGVLPDGRALLWEGWAYFWRADVRTGAATRMDLRGAFPAGELAEQCQLSPRGDRLAWVTYRDALGSLGDWAHNRVGSLGGRWKRQTVRTLWVSDVQGQGLHKVGCVSGEDSAPTAQIGTMQWLPGGTRISFLQGTTLYTVPVE